MINDDDDQVTTKQQCCVCRAESPLTNTNYTLISPRHQWRMELRTDEHGNKEPLWYCPHCWERMKQARRMSQPKGPVGR
ncbi:MAG: hypothetical protein QM784_01990 [Polyangiaceae bacterium]